MYRPVEIKPLKKYKLWVRYEDETSGEIDLSYMAGKGVFKFWDEKDNFFKVYIDKVSGAIAWSDKLDVCSDNIYFKLRGIAPEEQLLKRSA